MELRNDFYQGERYAEIYEAVNVPGKWHVRLHEIADGRDRWYGGKTLLLGVPQAIAIAVARRFVVAGEIPTDGERLCG